MSLAEDEVKVSPAQAQTLGVRVAHPVSSRTDQTLPYPAQIVIPTPQLWVVSAPVAGMVTSLSVARGDRVNSGQPLVTLESPSFVSLQRDYLHAFAQDVLAAQQLQRNTELFEGKAVPQRVLETSQAEARQASIARGGTAANASAQRALGCGNFAPDQRGGDYGDSFGRRASAGNGGRDRGFPGPAGGAVGAARQARAAVAVMGRDCDSGIEHPRHPAGREGGNRRLRDPGPGRTGVGNDRCGDPDHAGASRSAE